MPLPLCSRSRHGCPQLRRRRERVPPPGSGDCLVSDLTCGSTAPSSSRSHRRLASAARLRPSSFCVAAPSPLHRSATCIERDNSVLTPRLARSSRAPPCRHGRAKLCLPALRSARPGRFPPTPSPGSLPPSSASPAAVFLFFRKEAARSPLFPSRVDQLQRVGRAQLRCRAGPATGLPSSTTGPQPMGEQPPPDPPSCRLTGQPVSARFYFFQICDFRIIPGFAVLQKRPSCSCIYISQTVHRIKMIYICKMLRILCRLIICHFHPC